MRASRIQPGEHQKDHRGSTQSDQARPATGQDRLETRSSPSLHRECGRAWQEEGTFRLECPIHSTRRSYATRCGLTGRSALSQLTVCRQHSDLTRWRKGAKSLCTPNRGTYKSSRGSSLIRTIGNSPIQTRLFGNLTFSLKAT